MKKLARQLFLLAAFAPGLSLAACPSEGPEGDASSLQVISPTFSVSEEEGHRNITTLGTLKNSSGDCLEEIVVEIKFFDASKKLVDTVTQPVYGVVVPAGKDVAFRIRDVAAKPREAYAEQSVRVVSAEPRFSRGGRPQASSYSLQDFAVNWGPMLLLIGVWAFFIARSRSKNSPQGRTLALFEQQNAIFAEQSQLLARLAAAVEAKGSRQG